MRGPPISWASLATYKNFQGYDATKTLHLHDTRRSSGADADIDVRSVLGFNMKSGWVVYVRFKHRIATA